MEIKSLIELEIILELLMLKKPIGKITDIMEMIKSGCRTNRYSIIKSLIDEGMFIEKNKIKWGKSEIIIYELNQDKLFNWLLYKTNIGIKIETTIKDYCLTIWYKV